MQRWLSIARVVSEVKTTRHLVNIGYQQRAVGLLYEDTRFRWLCDKEQMQVGAAHAWRRGILSELGRIDDPDELRTVAEQICKMQPKTKTAVALIRRWRLGKAAKGGWVSLAVRLEQTVNEFKQANPSLSWKDIARALETVLEEVREKEAAGDVSRRQEGKEENGRQEVSQRRNLVHYKGRPSEGNV